MSRQRSGKEARAFQDMSPVFVATLKKIIANISQFNTTQDRKFRKVPRGGRDGVLFSVKRPTP
jgi:hypothetical protein